MKTPAAIELATTLAYAKGGYSVDVALGSEGRRANLILDTGSSSLAVLPHAYAPDRDAHLAATAWAQEVNYGGGAWAGPVLKSALAFGSGRHARRIEDALFAFIEADTSMLRDADGLLGLAYRQLNPAYDLATWLLGHGVDPQHTWPWPFEQGHALDLANFRDFLHPQPRTHLTPVFTALEQEGVVRDRFALTVGRAIVHVADDRAGLHHLAADPLNRGTLVLGGGAEHEHLHHGGFQDVRVLHDLYYNANLRAVRVGSQDPIPVPPLDPADVASRYSNALLDTGSSFLALEAATYQAVIEGFRRHDARLPALVERFHAAFAQGQGLPNEAVDLRHWPALHLHLEAPGGGDTVLKIEPGHYWPHNALNAGQTLFLLMPQLPHFPKQSILGLPVFCGRYAVFDRRGGDGQQGVVRFARAREPGR